MSDKHENVYTFLLNSLRRGRRSWKSPAAAARALKKWRFFFSFINYLLCIIIINWIWQVALPRLHAPNSSSVFLSFFPLSFGHSLTLSLSCISFMQSTSCEESTFDSSAANLILSLILLIWAKCAKAKTAARKKNERIRSWLVWLADTLLNEAHILIGYLYIIDKAANKRQTCAVSFCFM